MTKLSELPQWFNHTWMWYVNLEWYIATVLFFLFALLGIMILAWIIDFFDGIGG